MTMYELVLKYMLLTVKWSENIELKRRSCQTSSQDLRKAVSFFRIHRKLDTHITFQTGIQHYGYYRWVCIPNHSGHLHTTVCICVWSTAQTSTTPLCTANIHDAESNQCWGKQSKIELKGYSEDPVVGSLAYTDSSWQYIGWGTSATRQKLSYW